MIKNKDLNAIRTGQITTDQLLEIYPVKTLISDLIEIVKEKPVEAPKVVISQEQFEKHFRIAGIAADGTPQTRGRRKKQQDV